MVEFFDEDQIIVEDNVASYHGFNYFIVEIDDKFRPETFYKYDAVLLNLTDESLLQFAIKRIRSQIDPNVYLIPVFVLNTNEYNEVIINKLSDGAIASINSLDSIEPKVRTIRAKISRLNHPKVVNFESGIINRTLNMLFTRGKKTLEPIPYFHSGLGYYYPELSVNFDYKEEYNALKIMDSATKEGLFLSDFHERVYLCVNCHGGFLNFREVCPKCNSSNSTSQDLVHHFPCAYVGPIEDFKNEIDDQLSCPKCNKVLRHIGVDYDKPSILYTCNSCKNRFQDYSTRAKCTTCGSENEVEHLIPFTIKTYTMTKKGEDVAINGYINIEKQLESIQGTLPIDIFRVLLRYEIERLNNLKYHSNIGLLQIENATQVTNALGMEGQRDLMQGFVQILKSTLNPFDFISFFNSSTLLFSFVNAPKEEANEKINDLNKLISRLLSKSDEKIRIQITTKLQPLKKSIDADEAISGLISMVSNE